MLIMLSSLVKEHSQRQAVRREHQEVLRQNANKASAELTQALVDHLVSIVCYVYNAHNLIIYIIIVMVKKLLTNTHLFIIECRCCTSVSQSEAS